ncbi:MAG: hypothetical protein ABSC06_29285 [Rhodopila sp.]
MGKTDLSGGGDDQLADASAPPLGSGSTPSVVISAAVPPSVNVALWQNHVPVLTALSLRSDSSEAPGNVTLDLLCEPPVLKPRSWRLQGVAEGQIRIIDDLDVALDGRMLAGLTEGTHAEARFTARRTDTADGLLAELTCDIRVLARNEWGGSAGIPDILAAFVEPNDPAVAELLRLTSDRLRMAGKPDGLEGYQGGFQSEDMGTGRSSLARGRFARHPLRQPGPVF